MTLDGRGAYYPSMLVSTQFKPIFLILVAIASIGVVSVQAEEVGTAVPLWQHDTGG